MISTNVTPSRLKEYLRSSGWSLVAKWAARRQFVFEHPDFPWRQVSFPMDDTANDFQESVSIVLGKLAELERRGVGEILANIKIADDDAVSFRISSPSANRGFLSLSFARETILGAQQMLLASASTVLHPQLHHPRMGRTLAQELMEKTRFHHTEQGSFSLKVSCPVHAVEDTSQLSLAGSEPTFVRRVTENLFRSASDLVRAVELDQMEELVSGLREAPQPMISSNFCDALLHFGAEEASDGLEIEVLWASSLKSATGERRSKVRVQQDYFSRIEEIGRELRATEAPVRDFFVGTVERLDGVMGEDGKRSGDVVFSLLLPDGEQVRARAELTSEQYAKADHAHMRDGAFVMFRGWLHPGRQPRRVTELEQLELLEGAPGGVEPLG